MTSKETDAMWRTRSEQPEALRLADALENLYSKTVASQQAAAELRRLHAVNTELLEIAESVQGMISNCDVSSGICCCGDSMENHASPMSCGHTPRDSGEYAASSLLKKARAAIAKATGEQA